MPPKSKDYFNELGIKILPAGKIAENVGENYHEITGAV